MPTLAYWDIRGIGQPIRNLLVLAGVDFEDRRYPFGEGTSFADIDSIKQHWTKEKFSHGLDFPNLPYWIDEDVKLTQSNAIIKYLARKYGLIAEDIVTLAKQEMIEQQIRDYYYNFAMNVAYSPNYEIEKGKFLSHTMPEHLEPLNNYLGANEWFTPQLSYADILVYELLDTYHLFSPSTFDNYPTLKAFMARFENLPRIKEYFNSNLYKRWPPFSPFGQWGYHSHHQ